MANVFEQFHAEGTGISEQPKTIQGQGLSESEGNVFSQFHEEFPATPEPIAKPIDLTLPQIPGFQVPPLVSEQGFGADIMQGVKNLAGIPEGIAGLASGAASFIGGTLAGAGPLLKGVVAGEPVKGLAAAKEESERFMEATSFQPRTKIGKRIIEIGSAPFVLAADALMSSMRDRAWRKSLNPEQLKAVSEGQILNPKALKDAWLELNPEAGVEEGKAAQSVFDIILARSAFKGKKPRRKPTEAEITKAREVFDKVDEQVPDLVDKVEIVKDEPQVSRDITDVITDAIKESERTETATFSANQEVVNILRDKAETLKGKEKGFYTRAANHVDKLDKGIEGNLPKSARQAEIVTEALGERKVQEPLAPAEPAAVAEPAGAPAEKPPGIAEKVEPVVAEEVPAVVPEAVEPVVDVAPEPFRTYADKAEVLADDKSVPLASRFESFESADKRALEYSKKTGDVTDVAKIGDKFAVIIEKESPVKRFESIDSANMQVEIIREEPDTARALEYAKNPEEGLTVVEVDGRHYYAAEKFEYERKGNEINVENEMGQYVETTALERELEMDRAADAFAEGGLAETAAGDVRVKAKDKWVTPEEAQVIDKGKKDRYVKKLNEQKKPVVEPSEVDIELARERFLNFNLNVGDPKGSISRLTDLTISQRNKLGAGLDNLMSIHGTSLPIVKRIELWDSIVKKKDGIKEPLIITPEDSALINPDFSTFESQELAIAHKESNGYTGKIIRDPLTDRWIVEPDLAELGDLGTSDFIEYGDMLEPIEGGGVDLGEPSVGVGQRMIDILREETGAAEVSGFGIDIASLRRHVNSMEKLLRSAERAKVPLEAWLDNLGINAQAKEAFIAAAKRLPQDLQRLKEEDPIVENYLKPENVVYEGGYKKTKNGVVKKVSTGETFAQDMFAAARSGKDVQHSKNILGKFLKSTETRAKAFERIGKGSDSALWEVYYQFLEKSTDAQREQVRLIKDIDTIQGEFTTGERNNMAIAAYADQIGGAASLKEMGIDKIPVLTAKEVAGVQRIKDILADQFERINYVRANTGQVPISLMENYIPFVRSLNLLRDLGIKDSITQSKLSRLDGIAKEFRGVYNPYSKKRTSRGIPLELDIFSAAKKYLGYSLKEIHVAPISAAVKTVATKAMDPNLNSLKKGQKATKTTLGSINPELAELLIEWSDEIIGVDQLASQFAKRNPFISMVSKELHKNITYAMIMGNISTVMKQPGALVGTVAHVGLRNTIAGVARAAGEKVGFGNVRAEKLSNVLDIRSPDFALTEAAEIMKARGFDGFRTWLANKTGKPMVEVDAFTAQATWHAAYRKAIKEKELVGREAVKYADMVTIKANAMGIRGSVSPIQNAVGFRWLTMLQTFAINDFNYIVSDLLGYKNPSTKNSIHVKRFIKYTIAASALNSLNDMLSISTSHPAPIQTYLDGKERGESDRLAIAKGLVEFFEKVPIVGGVVKFGSTPLGPLAQELGDAGNALQVAISMVDTSDMSNKEKFNSYLLLAETMGTMTGISMTNQIRKSVRTASKGGDPWEIIMGAYIEEGKKSRRPRSGASPGARF